VLLEKSFLAAVPYFYELTFEISVEADEISLSTKFCLNPMILRRIVQKLSTSQSARTKLNMRENT